jgi:hypothetical protein
VLFMSGLVCCWWLVADGVWVSAVPGGFGPGGAGRLVWRCGRRWWLLVGWLVGWLGGVSAEVDREARRAKVGDGLDWLDGSLGWFVVGWSAQMCVSCCSLLRCLRTHVFVGWLLGVGGRLVVLAGGVWDGWTVGVRWFARWSGDGTRSGVGWRGWARVVKEIGRGRSGVYK